MYQVLVHFASANELVMSLDAFLYTPNKGMEMGADWVAQVRGRLGRELSWTTPSDPYALSILAWQWTGGGGAAAPAPDAGPADYIDWLAGLSPGELYERMAPYVPPQKTEILRDLGAWQSHVLGLLRTWHDGYFAGVGPGALGRLATDAQHRRAQAGSMAAVDLVETATTGFVVESDQIDQLLLIPQMHFRPLIRYAKCNRLLVVHYPVETAEAQPGAPGPDLMRLVRALADETRLRIMHFLTDSRPRSFTDVMKHLGMAKNTTHYHLSTLRTAGLVRFHVTGECETLHYTVRRAALDEIGPWLHRFLDKR
ncbi:MAG: ArsR family transcriptional regulator [Symbiobacteriaceae bacterium]|nr:ArsR family transcriptional regulator [Symbiobacteriaceae bacterium]